MSENTYMRTVLLGFCIRSCDFFQVTHPIILKTPGRRWEQCYVISGSGFRTPPTVINKNNSSQDSDQTDRTKLLVYLLHIQSNIQICLTYDYSQIISWKCDFHFYFFFQLLFGRTYNAKGSVILANCRDIENNLLSY